MEAVRSKKTKTKPSGKAQVCEKKVFTLDIHLMLKSTCIREGQISVVKNRLSVGKSMIQPQHDIIVPLEKLTVNK